MSIPVRGIHFVQQNQWPPDGEYAGIWGGYHVKFDTNSSGLWEGKSDIGIRTPAAPCVVTVAGIAVDVRLAGDVVPQEVRMGDVHPCECQPCAECDSKPTFTGGRIHGHIPQQVMCDAQSVSLDVPTYGPATIYLWPDAGFQIEMVEVPRGKTADALAALVEVLRKMA